jgi:hypothetical protein
MELSLIIVLLLNVLSSLVVFGYGNSLHYHVWSTVCIGVYVSGRTATGREVDHAHVSVSSLEVKNARIHASSRCRPLLNKRKNSPAC